MQILLKFKRRMKSRAYRRIIIIRALLVFFSGLSISLVFVSGPYVQSAFTSFVSGDKSSLYDGISGTGIGSFPTIGAYIRAAFWPPYLICGGAVAIAMAWLNSKRGFLIGVSLVAAAGLTAIDIANGTNTPQDLAVSVVCNILGGIILSLFSFIIVANVSIIRLVSDGNKYVERGMWIIWPTVCYLISTCAIIFILAFIIKIPPASVSMRLTPPLSGYVSTIYPLNCGQPNLSNQDKMSCYSTKPVNTKDSGNFNILGTFSSIKNGENKWTGFGKKLSIDWKKNNSSITRAKLYMTQGCTTREQLVQMLKTAPFEKDVVMSDSRIDIDDGVSQFQVITPDYTGQIEVNDPKITFSQFWITPSTNNPSKVNVSRFVYDGLLRITDQFKPLSYEISMYPQSEKNSRLKSRRMTFLTKNSSKSKFIDVQFESGSIDPNSALTCKELKLTAVTGGYTAIAETPLISMIVSIDHAKDVTYTDLENPDTLDINGINGFMSSDFDKSQINAAIRNGKFGMISVIGAISDVQVNDKTVSTGPTGTLQLSGTLSGNSDGPSILIEGDANFMSLNDHRMTLTRWESLDTEMRVPIIFGIPTALYFLLRILSEALRRPMRHVWYLPK